MRVGGAVKGVKGFRRNKWGDDTPQKGHGKGLPSTNKPRRSDMGQLFGLNIRSERYAAETSEQFLLNERSVEIDEDMALRKHKRACVAAAASHPHHFTIDDDGDMCAFNIDDKPLTTLGEGVAAARRCTIAFFFGHHYGCPPESEWAGRGDVLQQIMRRVGVPEGPKDFSREVF